MELTQKKLDYLLSEFELSPSAQDAVEGTLRFDTDVAGVTMNGELMFHGDQLYLIQLTTDTFPSGNFDEIKNLVAASFVPIFTSLYGKPARDDSASADEYSDEIDVSSIYAWDLKGKTIALGCLKEDYHYRGLIRIYDQKLAAAKAQAERSQRDLESAREKELIKQLLKDF